MDVTAACDTRNRDDAATIIVNLEYIDYNFIKCNLNCNVLLYDSIFLLLFIFGLWVTKIYDSNDKILFIALSIHSQNEQIKIISY